MDQKDLELYLEEQRELLITLGKGIGDLRDGIQKQIEIYKAPLENVEVSGSVEVNTEKEVEVTNLEVLDESLASLGTTLEKAIKDNSYKPLDEVSVSNIKDAVPKELSVNNLSDLAKYFTSLETAIKNNQPILNVTKQEIKFPTSAKEAIPVRLSDGKSFYNAITAAISSGHQDTDPLVGYQPSDIDDSSTPKYYGFVKSGGRWYIMRESSGAYRYARGAPQDQGGGIYSDAWTDRANLTYSYFYEVF